MTQAEEIMGTLSKVVDKMEYKKASGNADGAVYEFSDGSKLVIEVKLGN